MAQKDIQKLYNDSYSEILLFILKKKQTCFHSIGGKVSKKAPLCVIPKGMGQEGGKIILYFKFPITEFVRMQFNIS